MKMQDINFAQTKISLGSNTVLSESGRYMNSKNVDLKYKFRYPGNATITKHSGLPESPYYHIQSALVSSKPKVLS